MHASAAILSIGDELAFGQKLDTNSRWLADRLVSRGIPVREHVTIADDLAAHIDTLRRLAAVHPLVISTGGLGPTLDDLTRRALAVVMREDLVEDADALEHLRDFLARRGRELTDLQRTQALRPRTARCIDNLVGTAPGLHGVLHTGATASGVGRGEHSATDVFCLPGPPHEMQPMFERAVAPHLKPARRIVTRVLHCLGLAEADLATRLGPLMDRTRNPLVGTTASSGIVSIRIRYETPLQEAAPDESTRKTRMIETTALDGTLRAARTAAHPFHFGEDNDTIESVLLNLLRARGDRLVTAESCTAGALGALFSETPGASDVFLGGWITYSNEMKTASLGAPADLIAQHGAVSEPVARAMAEGALRKTLLSPPLPAGEMSESSGTEGESPPRPRGALHALAITGIAGPAGGSPRKPVGTVFIARASSSASPEADSDESSRRRRIPASPDIRRFLITGDRADIRDRSAKLALMMLRFHLLGLDVPRTLWQVQLDGSPFQAR